MNSTYINQELLLSQLKHIFPKEDPLVEVRKQAKLKYPSTGSYLEIDIWLPKQNLGFEFQDTYHYITTWYSQRTKENIKLSDSAKKTATQRAGISLIVVPCWWDGGIPSLVSSIGFQRPDLIPIMQNKEVTPMMKDKHTNRHKIVKRDKPLFVAPVSLNPHRGFFPGEDLPDVGELMSASFPLNSSTDFVDSNSWWMGEKYDGVRFCWHPKRSAVYTRRGRELELAPSVQENFPSEFVDGEFWFGRGSFSLTYMLSKESLDFVHWHSLRAVSFDVPAPKLHSFSFETRYEKLLDIVEADHPILVVAPRVACLGSEHLIRAVGEIIENAGEGTILRLVGSRYFRGRSPSLIKFKAANADKEGLVVDVEEGSVTLKLPNGQEFVVPPQNVHIPTPTKGEVVTFSYEINARREMPVSPVIYRTRNDVEWDELLHSDANESFLLNNEQAQTKIFTAQPQGFWTHANMRTYLIDLAQSFNLDPFSSDTWQAIPFKAISQTKSGRLIVRKFGGYMAALKSLFPEVDLESSEAHHLWSSIENRRKFFENYAKSHGFDPHFPDNWYSQRPQRILSEKGASRVMFYHGYSVSRALLDLFPDIGLDKTRLGKWSWQYSVNRRQFFEGFAASSKFDPLVADNWYMQSREKILSAPAASFVILYHNNLIAQSLLDLFPDVAFDRLKLLYHFDYRHMVTAIKFFENYAKKQGFDPLNPENWYSQSLKNIIVLEGAKKILNRHKNTLSVALLELFPGIGLEKAYFNKVSLLNKKTTPAKEEEEEEGSGHPLSYLDIVKKRNMNIQNTKEKPITTSERNEPKEKDPEKARNEYTKRFFVSFAKQKGFDHLVPENWYSQSRSEIISTTGANKAIAKFKGSVSKALYVVFPNIGLIKSKLWASLWNELRNRRKFFENYAKHNGFSPLVPENWYSIDIRSIVSAKGFLDVIIHHKDNVTQALLDLFPEIGLEKSKMSPHSVWHDAIARRTYFENYARERQFDPLKAQDWLEHPLDKVLAAKGAIRVVSYHQGKVSRALLDLFPDIGFNKSSFWTRTSLESPNDRRKVFENFAQDHHFDPRDPKNWYAYKDKLMHAKGVKSVLRYHNSSIAKALTELFPNIGLSLSLLRTGPSWPDKETRLKVFENYARTHGFDPHDPEGWYAHTKLRASSMKRGGFMTMVYYGGNLHRALFDLFPDIGLDPAKLQANEEAKK